jgi:hypothetical protein
MARIVQLCFDKYLFTVKTHVRCCDMQTFLCMPSQNCLNPQAMSLTRSAALLAWVQGGLVREDHGLDP